MGKLAWPEELVPVMIKDLSLMKLKVAVGYTEVDTARDIKVGWGVSRDTVGHKTTLPH